MRIVAGYGFVISKEHSGARVTIHMGGGNPSAARLVCD